MNSFFRQTDNAWHRAINAHAHLGGPDFPHWMYEAKTAAGESERLPKLFERERLGMLSKVFRPCACCSNGKHVVDNHLTCCMGIECRKCPHLLALDACTDLTPEQIDTMKSWTCIGHILSKGGDPMNEGYILTVDDRMFWDRVFESLASSGPDATEGQ
jgi:hypothetical protein